MATSLSLVEGRDERPSVKVYLTVLVCEGAKRQYHPLFVHQPVCPIPTELDIVGVGHTTKHGAQESRTSKDNDCVTGAEQRLHYAQLNGVV